MPYDGISRTTIRKTLRGRRNHPSCCPRWILTNTHTLVLFPIPFSMHADMDKWCSFCNDFGETLVLCSTCRVCVCVTGPASARGCLRWDPCIDIPEFVFRCPLCTKRSKSPCAVCTETVPKTSSLLTMDAQLKLAVDLPDIRQIHFRYDPAVLIVSLAWGETQISFGAQLHCHLSRRYVNDPSSVGLPMDLRLTVNADPHAGHVAERSSQGHSRQGV